MKEKEEKLMRVIKIDINKNDKLYEICKNNSILAKNLFNATNYIIRQVFIISKRIKSGLETKEEVLVKYNEIVKDIENFNKETSTKKIEFKECWGGLYVGGKGAKTPLKAYMKDKYDFLQLPSTTSNEIVEQVVNSWQAYFESLKSYCKDKSKFKGLPKPPNYKLDICGFIIGKGTTTIKDGQVSFKNARKGLRSFEDFNVGDIKVPLDDWDRCKSPDGRLTYIRVVSKNESYTMEFVYNIGIKPQLKQSKNRIIAIDIGVDRLATVSNNIGEKPFCINGNPLKSLNKHWNKKISKYKSVLMTTNALYSSKKYKNMCDKRNNQMSTYMHQSASYIIKWCEKYDIDTIVIGKNKGWKQKTNIGNETQTFVQIPFAKFINKIEYRAEGLGIKVVLQEESYTSKASFIDNDNIPTYGVNDKDNIFSGKRIKRGLYKSKENLDIHADLNGAYNILRKYDKNFKYNKGCFLHPYIIKKPNINIV